MLWYKAWLETRSRFVIALVGCVAFCLMWVVEFGKGIVASRGQAGLYELFHMAHAGLCFCWVLAVTFLMMGGLLQEKVVGASAFTLGLPVSRLRLMSVRFGMGFVQAIALAVCPMDRNARVWQGGGLPILLLASVLSCISVAEWRGGLFDHRVPEFFCCGRAIHGARGQHRCIRRAGLRTERRKARPLQSREIHGGLRWVFVANGTSDWTRPVVARGRVWCRRRVIVYDFCQGNRTL